MDNDDKEPMPAEHILRYALKEDALFWSRLQTASVLQVAAFGG